MDRRSFIAGFTTFLGAITVAKTYSFAQAKEVSLTDSLIERINAHINECAKHHLFEFNDAFTRASFKNNVVSLLINLKAEGKINDYSVICDESNNTPENIDKNMLIADVYFKPTKALSFVKINVSIYPDRA
jgi:hypothetical protein